MTTTESNPPPGAPAAWQRAAVPVLFLALVAAGAYIAMLRGRLADLERKAAAPRPAEVPAAVEHPAPASDMAALGPAQESAMLGVLATETDPNRKVWFLAPQNNADAAAALAALQRIFEKAGWPTETSRSAYPLKAGVFLLAADEDPPLFVTTVNDALTAAGIEAKYLTGYRDFYRQRKTENPNYTGPELAADQPFVLAIGSKPPAAPAAP